MKNKIKELFKNEIDRINYRDNALLAEHEVHIERIKEIEQERDSLTEKLHRATQFPPDFTGCFICFVHEGLTTEFIPVHSDSELDNFKCSHCGYLLEVEV